MTLKIHYSNATVDNFFWGGVNCPVEIRDPIEKYTSHHLELLEEAD